MSLWSVDHCQLLLACFLSLALLPGLLAMAPAANSPTRLRSSQILRMQLRELQENPSELFSAGLVDDSNMLEWNICISGPPDSLYEGGIFSARLSFPENYPDKPPSMKFLTPIWHPNVYSNGDVCISILHAPGEDATNPQELASMRWNPVHTVETIVLSVISMLSDPTDDSPANVEAAVELRNNFNLYKQHVSKCVADSLEM
ncbi:ubiquitin-conjugating enzyme Ubc14 [Guillardia theta CCMP2712]|uniref:Ubiquitin-conjugating enzyme Ubc14 n=2 Tax=Guillardia theta TaxID=55529 RepID=L1JIW7_GUITC|nr:ubiquitin-conjugating enzyme Ubc14 [Guillardia theta CCMP2712]EKX48035.1 ubiquitin-conjugating enzyme Ubc14 [Guillardia theta CCMP2712]CAJ73915.1 ubiquitin conjugating enzyme [Guillardia theta]|eukprot:XP_005835015.1 ubiquitin-conjugating enzyme Ubc14 [Guillardia theta CCMP2712]